MGTPLPSNRKKRFNMEDIVMGINRTSQGLSNAVFEELELLRNGESTPQKSSAIARLANTVCQISRLEMDFARFVAVERSEGSSALKNLPMGQIDGPK